MLKSSDCERILERMFKDEGIFEEIQNRFACTEVRQVLGYL
jgi:hypothetical protein